MATARGPFRRVLRLVSTHPKRYRKVWESMHPKSIAARAVTIALDDVGYSEEPRHNVNDNKFGREFGENYVPWCGLAVASWWKRAGFNVPRELALEIDYVPRLLELAHGRKHGLFPVGKNRVRRGDAVAFDFPGGARADHVGLFIGWLDKQRGAFETVEGNTSKHGSQANGGAVETKIRYMHEVAGFVRKRK